MMPSWGKVGPRKIAQRFPVSANVDWMTRRHDFMAIDIGLKSFTYGEVVVCGLNANTRRASLALAAIGRMWIDLGGRSVTAEPCRDCPAREDQPWFGVAVDSRGRV